MCVCGGRVVRGRWEGGLVCAIFINDVVVTSLYMHVYCVCTYMCQCMHVCDCVCLHTYSMCLHDFVCVCSYSPLVGEVSIKISSTTLNLISSSMSINMSCFSSPASYSHTHSCSFWSLWQQHMLNQGNSIKHQLELWCCYSDIYYRGTTNIGASEPIPACQNNCSCKYSFMVKGRRAHKL